MLLVGNTMLPYYCIVFSVINSGLEDQVDAKDDEDGDAEEDNQP